MSMHSIDDDAVLWRDGADGREGSPLLIVMHGLGSHEGDLFALAKFIPEQFTVASLRAPLRYGDGWAWFAAGSQSSSDQSLITASARGVLAWLDRQTASFSSVGLLGFSQGGAMTLQLARLAPSRFAFLLQLSGFVAAGDNEGDAALAALSPRLPAFQAVGSLDPVIETASTERTIAWMNAHLDVTRRDYPMGHSISQEELADIVAFLAAR